MAISVTADRMLNHVEMAYRPGERELAKLVFELLGCEHRDSGGPFLSVRVDPATGDFLDNAIYASEVTPEQWGFEQTLARSLDGEAGRSYLELLARAPQRAFHFGIGFAALESWEAAVARIADAGDNHPELGGRIGVRAVFRPGDPGSFGDTFVQAFVHTDVVAAGFLTIGQHIELQHYFPEHRR